MATLKAIRDAIAATLGAIEGLTAYAEVQESVNTPAVMVAVADSDFELTFGRGTDAWALNLIVLVSPADWGVAQNQLDEYAQGSGAKSIRQTIFNNKTFGLADGTNGHITGMSGYGGAVQLGDIDYVGATLHLSVYTPGTA